jgi:5-methylthioadenosine/S-adenosylhomocysteine deaminase
VYSGALLAMAELIRGGTTMFNDMYLHSNEVARAAATAHIRGAVGSTIFDFPTSDGKTLNEYLSNCKYTDIATNSFYSDYLNCVYGRA